MTSRTPALTFDILTLEPAIWSGLDYGVVGRAQREALWALKTWQLRDYADKDDGRVDDKPYGGDPGMLLAYPPLDRAMHAIQTFREQKPFVVLLDPAGTPVTQDLLTGLVKQPLITFVCGRYEGIDHRFTEQHVDLSVSIGSFVVSAGDLPAMLMVDAMTRLIPGTLGNQTSVETDSFQDWLVDHPSYTRPRAYRNQEVPLVLREGHHQKISQWRHQQRLGRTLTNHPSRFIGQSLTAEDVLALEQYFLPSDSNN